ncbi:nucleotide exchange factor GrpE [Denitrificimonas caeni]|uniref:Protein GrpE n=1 Tax=Denitrificimonas caeni TaxID=521720 RepID=A0AAF0AJ67_9GAMM|nr:nucleotide exchange factor GrpE [Denitrificimonas caeni]NLJ11803.1 nucleotide exchange factor GrpE [Gammaproteobacteria bacterium]WBE25150.1 nucleotide exchange factor GrpE [Denitrificimonas caeni]
MTDEQTLDEQTSDVPADEQQAAAGSVESAQERIAELEDQLASAQENVLRAAAEVQNIRRRADQDVEKAHKFALEKFATDLLAVLDSLERGIEVSDATDEAIRPMREGMELTYKLFLDTMKRFKVERLDPQGEPFNPEEHQAMAMEESTHVEPNSVLKVFQCGYSMNGRLLRPAMVVVSKAPSEPPVKIDEQA